ncbi:MULTISPECIES: amidophosphoribosyltransferase [Capnocytophaga]|uniref:Glutamine phosphoribosylpyrophosphate amidotransferase n=2 Tax=Capnocytophaga TaxID=1016 RepID=A0A0B7H6T0_9FLAO|nr:MULTISPECIES: amidophosphoribosyltransferase [Capnocytophaga]ATA77566.1 amidophosphoribosyltransferase [Capnocytophaga canimorsus]AWL79038.1 amidophosphoribosyltransferase [Capnocytophaga canimorsus]MDT9499038.1 amidophosphoribosyltransferase [Capnocytophaga canimorsus]PJI82549.1 amidophosphoribosyltransferase [Capnocytophaga canimorsus]CEN33338.1 Glutamine phosphoribosylpyrophosphate amidotransferase [Capnocytophaga cynodegmi]
MSDNIKHECGIAMVRLLKPLSFYKEKYGTTFYGINKMYLMLEKQHNRGQDGAGLATIKLDMQPGERYISRVRSNQPQPIQDIFTQVNQRISELLKENPDLKEDVQAQKKLLPYVGEVYLGHVRYGTFGQNSIENVHPFLRQNNWQSRNLIVAGNFNMTNAKELFERLVALGQHPKENTDTVTVMERIGHFLDTEVEELYQKFKEEGLSKVEASKRIADELDVAKILRKSARRWDGGYAMAGILGHGDAFVVRDPAGIRPAYYYKDEEVVVIASERPVIQTAFNLEFEQIHELEPGSGIIIKKDGSTSVTQIIPQLPRKACSFERIYFSRGSDKEIYLERKKLGALLLPEVLQSINNDLKNSVFAYIPNTAETSYLGLVEEADSYLNKLKHQQILAEKDISSEKLAEILSQKIRKEKVAIKDAKLRTFITEDSSRDDLVAHVYDITYGSVQKGDNLVIIDDSIVRGTTLKKSILNILGRLKPKKIVVVSSAPQIRYPDCYGIDMARLEDLIAFEATLQLHKERGTYNIIEEVYKKCIAQVHLSDDKVINYVKEIYEPFTDEEITDKITELLLPKDYSIDVKIIFQSVANLHKACPQNLGDWYFTGNYPTDGGNRVVNRAFINFYEGKKDRAY